MSCGLKLELYTQVKSVYAQAVERRNNHEPNGESPLIVRHACGLHGTPTKEDKEHGISVRNLSSRNVRWRQLHKSVRREGLILFDRMPSSRDVNRLGTANSLDRRWAPLPN